MYLDKYVTADMSYDEAKEVMDQMLDRLLFDVPEEYHVVFHPPSSNGIIHQRTWNRPLR